MEIDPFIFRLSIFILSIFIGYYVVWSVTPSLHTPLMSVTNAISSVIIVGAIIAGLAGNSDSIFNTSSIFGFLAISLAAVNIFGGFLVTQRMLAMYKKRKRTSYDFCKFICNFLLNFWGAIYLSIKGLVISRDIKTRKFFWYNWYDNCNNSYIPIYRKFFKWFYICDNFSVNRWFSWCFYSLQNTHDGHARTCCRFS